MSIGRKSARSYQVALGGAILSRLPCDALPDECAFVAIHDATRPLITPTLIEAGVALARETGVAVPTEPVKETIKRVRDGEIVGAVPRERLMRTQTPQFFTRPLLQEAYQRAAPDLDPPDEAALLLRVGLPISCYAGRSREPARDLSRRAARRRGVAPAQERLRRPRRQLAAGRRAGSRRIANSPAAT